MPGRAIQAGAQPLIGIIDIGSNSIRLVVYRGDGRTPPVIFNEKVMAGLGRGVAATGALSEASTDLAVATLKRFALLARDMRVRDLRTVATAAVRDASNGEAFVRRVRRECRLDVRVIAGEEEARLAAFGVIAGIPDADGIVGDLGGGSLELVRVRKGRSYERVSLPIGSLRLDSAGRKSRRQMAQVINRALDAIDWTTDLRGLPFYTVGGSWRALTQLHMAATGYPLPVIHQYEMPGSAPDYLVRLIARRGLDVARAVPNISASRVPSLPGAAALLRAVTGRLQSSMIIASAYGLREGLLYAGLSPSQRREDPLVAAARDEGQHQGRFPAHGEALMRWMNGLFAPESKAQTRLRLAACLLSDVAWRAHPDFRAERGLDVALHDNWVGITASERAMLASALFACFGGTADDPVMARLTTIAGIDDIARARLWGLTLRLGQRLTGGTAQALADSRLRRSGNSLLLSMRSRHAGLYGDAVERRHRALASALGLKPLFRIVG